MPLSSSFPLVNPVPSTHTDSCDLPCKPACSSNLVILLEVNCFYKLCVTGLFSSFKFAHKLNSTQLGQHSQEHTLTH